MNALELEKALRWGPLSEARLRKAKRHADSPEVYEAVVAKLTVPDVAFAPIPGIQVPQHAVFTPGQLDNTAYFVGGEGVFVPIKPAKAKKSAPKKKAKKR